MGTFQPLELAKLTVSTRLTLYEIVLVWIEKKVSIVLLTRVHSEQNKFFNEMYGLSAGTKTAVL